MAEPTVRGKSDGAGMPRLTTRPARKRFFVDDAALYLDFAQRVCDLSLKEIRAGWEEKAALFRRALQIAKSVRRAQLRDLSVPFAEEHLPCVDAEETERSILGEVSRQVLLEVIEAMPPRQREAATLAWIVDYPKAGSGDSVASVMNISEAAVHKLLTKARGRLMNDPRVRAMVEDRESA